MDSWIAVCPHCDAVTRGDPCMRKLYESYEELPHASPFACIAVLREKLENVLSRLEDHRL